MEKLGLRDIHELPMYFNCAITFLHFSTNSYLYFIPNFNFKIIDFQDIYFLNVFK